MGEEEGGSKGNTVVRWERFLPRMFLRVLLVEADDCTRQIIAALLRKCSYKVAAVSDGLKAWETLKEKCHFIDLVLTEVELPSVSGFCLLTMIMEHEACKNIPVIMMSSQDSVSMVFKCMLRGAADFLVKPIRKNELRNLWQHVWRRQSSNSAKQGGQDENIPVANIDAMEENNAASNQSSGNVARVQKTREQNEKGNDTQNESMKVNMPLVQSSCTKQNVDAESPTMHDVQEPLNPNHPSNSQDSNGNVEIGEEDMDCAIISQMLEIVKNGKVAQGTSPDQGMSENYNVKLVRPSEEAIDLIGALDNQPQFSCTNRDQLCAHDGDGADHHSSEKVERSSSNSPLLELSLKRSLSNSCENDSTREKPTLNHSYVSAFSRYDNKIGKPQVLLPNGLVTEMREGSSSNHLSMSSPVTPNGSATSRFQIPAPVPMRGIGFDGFGSGYSALLQPVFYGSPGVQVWTENSVTQHEMINERSSNQPNQGAHNFNQNQHVNGQTANRPIYRPMPRLDQHQEASKDQVRFDSVTTPIGSNGLCNGTEKHLNSNGGVIGKACDSGGRNNNTAATANAIDNGINNDGRFANGVVGGMSYLKSSEREAALNKFRLKRKERCFEKKVRYQSRKKLAEQRPRVKGQFVRQVQSDP